jgi:hypothetical protein
VVKTKPACGSSQLVPANIALSCLLCSAHGFQTQRAAAKIYLSVENYKTIAQKPGAQGETP